MYTCIFPARVHVILSYTVTLERMVTAFVLVMHIVLNIAYTAIKQDEAQKKG